VFENRKKAYVIAEIGANHNGDMDLARKMIDEAKKCGADAVKFQSWDTTIFSKSVYEKNYFLGDDYRNRTDFTLKEIVDEFSVTADQMGELAQYCRSQAIDFSSTPFNERQIDELVACGAPYVKIASMDIDNPRLLRHAAGTGMPIVLSTGFSQLAEIDRAVRWIEDAGNSNIAILHCVSLYPPEDREVNLNNIEMLQSAFGYAVGFSDHTMGTEIPIAALAKGAVIIEKHFTLDRDMFGWDHKMSCTPEELEAICTARDRLSLALGGTKRVVGAREMERRQEYRRSIVSARALKAGSVITAEDLDIRRPGTGIPPHQVDQIVGMTVTSDIAEDTILDLSHLGAPLASD